MTPRSCLRWKPTGRVFKNVVLRWVPTGKTFASSTTKVDSEPPNGSNADITNQCESEQALDVSAADQASVFMAMTSVHISSGLVLHQMTSDHNRSELEIHDHNNEPSSSKLVPKVVPLAVKTATSRQDHKVVRLGINPMIQPELEDLPKDNPKLEIAVLRLNWGDVFKIRHSMRMLVKDSRSQDGIDDKDNDEGSKSRSQSMKEQAYNK
ncbi:hypothetical protein Tco_0731433 [Tanacetum coccineum]